jgi:1,2-diacylglycerol 3-beta-glucosyltransferase
MVVLLAWLIATPLVVAAGYRAVLAISYLVCRESSQQSPETPAPATRFLAIVPAHNEELLIAELIESIRCANYPQSLIEILVIADNCTDATADCVRSLGERVVVRDEPKNRGKGQAIDWTLQRTDLSGADAVAFFDADNIVDKDFFRAMHSELAAGHRCLQGYYGIANPDESPMTRLLATTYVMKNLLFNGGKRALGLSVLLMGTGMVFTREAIANHGWKAMSIGEDLEQTFRLIEAGEHIRFVPDARIRAQEVTTMRQGSPQRQRWASGRRALYAVARRTIATGIREGDVTRIDIGLDLLMPTYSKLLNWTLVGLIAAALLYARAPALIWAVGGVLAYQIAEASIAMRLMRADLRFIGALGLAPLFLVWKGVIDLLAVAGYRRNTWTRTDRAPHHGSERD